MKSLSTKVPKDITATVPDQADEASTMPTGEDPVQDGEAEEIDEIESAKSRKSEISRRKDKPNNPWLPKPLDNLPVSKDNVGVPNYLVTSITKVERRVRVQEAERGGRMKRQERYELQREALGLPPRYRNPETDPLPKKKRKHIHRAIAENEQTPTASQLLANRVEDLDFNRKIDSHVARARKPIPPLQVQIEEGTLDPKFQRILNEEEGIKSSGSAERRR
jgi:hypothetical protein